MQVQLVLGALVSFQSWARAWRDQPGTKTTTANATSTPGAGFIGLAIADPTLALPNLLLGLNVSKLIIHVDEALSGRQGSVR
jgi:hypothetical protein